MDSPASALDKAVARLATASTDYLAASAQDGPTETLVTSLEAVQAAVADLAIEVGDPASSPVFVGWLTTTEPAS